MKVQTCTDFDEATESCLSPLVWVGAEEFHQAGEAPWLDVEGAITIALAIGGVWATAWTLRALAQYIRSYI